MTSKSTLYYIAFQDRTKMQYLFDSSFPESFTDVKKRSVYFLDLHLARNVCNKVNRRTGHDCKIWSK
jgi:hypothetical protein